MKSFITESEYDSLTSFQSYCTYMIDITFWVHTTFYGAYLKLGAPDHLKREGIIVWHPCYTKLNKNECEFIPRSQECDSMPCINLALIKNSQALPSNAKNC